MADNSKEVKNADHLRLSNTFFNTNKGSTADKATSLDLVLRDKKFLLLCAIIFLIAAGASVFLIYGVISSPQIAQWLAPIHGKILNAIQTACLVFSGASFMITIIAACDCYITEKYKTPEELTNENTATLQA